MRKAIIAAIAASMLLLTSFAASAAITFDAETGTGFVGKGDVQYTFGWNNKQLQDNAASVQVRVNLKETSEVSWECTNANNDKVQERERTTTTTTTGLVTTVGRLKNQITGFNLNGYGVGYSNTTETDGPPLNSCPNANGTWSLTSPAGDPVVTGTSGGGFEVSGDDGTTWRTLLEAPSV